MAKAKLLSKKQEEQLVKWVWDFIKYTVLPTAIAFLTALQTGNLQIAWGAAYGTGIAALINFLNRYQKTR